MKEPFYKYCGSVALQTFFASVPRHFHSSWMQGIISKQCGSVAQQIFLPLLHSISTEAVAEFRHHFADAPRFWIAAEGGDISFMLVEVLQAVPSTVGGLDCQVIGM